MVADLSLKLTDTTIQKNYHGKKFIEIIERSKEKLKESKQIQKKLHRRLEDCTKVFLLFTMSFNCSSIATANEPE